MRLDPLIPGSISSKAATWVAARRKIMKLYVRYPNPNAVNKSKKGKINPDASMIDLDDSSVIKPELKSDKKKPSQQSTTKKKQQ